MSVFPEFGPEPQPECLIEFHIGYSNVRHLKWKDQFCPVCRHGWDFHGGLIDANGIVWRVRNGFGDPKSCFPPMPLSRLMEIVRGVRR